MSEGWSMYNYYHDHSIREAVKNGELRVIAGCREGCMMEVNDTLSI